MTAPSRAPLTTFLLRAGFLTAALAIIAGIFGMHIMTGAHHMSAAHTMPAAAAQSTVHLESLPASHSHRNGRVTERTTVTPGSHWVVVFLRPFRFLPGDVCRGQCLRAGPGKHNTDRPCPGTAPYALPDFGRPLQAGINYSYSPDSPSPGDLEYQPDINRH